MQGFKKRIDTIVKRELDLRSIEHRTDEERSGSDAIRRGHEDAMQYAVTYGPVFETCPLKRSRVPWYALKQIIYVHARTHTHTHIYIYIYFFVLFFVFVCMFSPHNQFTCRRRCPMYKSPNDKKKKNTI